MRSDETCRKLLEAIADLPLGETQIMEVCGTHTMAIAEAGIRSLLPKHIRLISGPGCPVCVTPPEDIDAVLDLAMEPDVVLTSYGDMLRVPGSRRGDSLMRRRALGADVRIVYSPVDAVEIAAQEPGKQVVFLGVGFETTAPGTAAALLTAKERELKNFTVLSLLKSVEPALRALMATEDFAVSGFLCPGHVATIIGEAGFRFLPEEYRMPGVISGFETGRDPYGGVSAAQADCGREAEDPERLSKGGAAGGKRPGQADAGPGLYPAACQLARPGRDSAERLCAAGRAFGLRRGKALPDSSGAGGAAERLPLRRRDHGKAAPAAVPAV